MRNSIAQNVQNASPAVVSTTLQQLAINEFQSLMLRIKGDGLANTVFNGKQPVTNPMGAEEVFA